MRPAKGGLAMKRKAKLPFDPNAFELCAEVGDSMKG